MAKKLTPEAIADLLIERMMANGVPGVEPDYLRTWLTANRAQLVANVRAAKLTEFLAGPKLPAVKPSEVVKGIIDDAKAIGPFYEDTVQPFLNMWAIREAIAILRNKPQHYAIDTEAWERIASTYCERHRVRAPEGKALTNVALALNKHFEDEWAGYVASYDVDDLPEEPDISKQLAKAVAVARDAFEGEDAMHPGDRNAAIEWACEYLLDDVGMHVATEYMRANGEPVEDWDENHIAREFNERMAWEISTALRREDRAKGK